MEHITSRKNKVIAHLRTLGMDAAYRRMHGEFVCDGEKFLSEALRHGAELVCALWSGTPTADPDCAQYAVPRELLEYVSPLKTTPGPLFSVRMREKPLAPAGRRFIILDGVQDPGNVGTVIRSANAFGLDAVILTGGCADLYNPKTVRATMGAIFRQSVLELPVEEAVRLVRGRGLTLCAAALSDRAEDIRSAGIESAAYVVGSEGKGVSPEMLAQCDKTVIIPMNPDCESLNAAVAASILAWEMGRRQD